MGKCFSAVTAAIGDQFSIRMEKARDLQLKGICIQGGWRNRRFQILEFKPCSGLITEPTLDIEGLQLLIPLDITSKCFVSACRSFGAKAERAFRDKHDHFERVADSMARVHTIHAYHHVALCQHKGPWPNTTDSAGGYPCVRCSEHEKLVPAHRARYKIRDEIASQSDVP
jgi:hypothetical protein